ncbi:lysophospholipid acyltransferase family protein [Anaerovoracaceae bacterium 41-7]|jgi:1-acyl-sn-glycerol-3-phosphate acyltransferase|uniref:1-acyl-sn-glycerol-3-phosphate acyltransferase n=1 Tax=Anaerotruncus colihominis TaxID=169435 RepID=A0A845QHJ0_9FIRM|nr:MULTISPECIES: lysophospholipid acyltransferase family protein [Clostridia]MCI9639144.1 1-acyl-sn-glycerol-3-phosphate acyltransferase [Emergencia sp.]NBH60571.1 1-acyl-sn-glycerol-3-phosphate acyltransferase [Anaerotruncus colihominis]NCE99508.1 1-acyl-sn-glycerol-3-phosphate acyltransferase [Emergencia sp. 1XD21-10]NCF01225.1 1-acyl-sn-glycerol-3-phosphate acyltransferase [Anaerotruncus sp. 80]
MNRLTKIILKNIFRVPSIFGRIYWYAAHPERYSGEEKLRPLQYIVERAKISGNLDIKVYGRENIPEKDGYIFYPNHQGIFDGFAMIEACQRPICPVMKQELMKIPGVKQIFTCMNALPMDRRDVKQSLRVINEVSHRVMQGENCIIFAEGTRSRNGNQLLEFKGGSFKAAVKAKCPVVPVALIDAYKPFDRNVPGFITVQVHILKPIYYEEYAGKKTTEIAQMVKSRIEENIAVYAEN